MVLGSGGQVVIRFRGGPEDGALRRWPFESQEEWLKCGSEYPGNLILDIPVSRTVRQKCLLKPQSRIFC